jgi:coproporphyrinogen III oxidase-like Fe-S oxidoreductase
VRDVQQEFPEWFARQRSVISELIRDALLEQEGEIIRLSNQGRLLSNEVFERFLSIENA